MPRLVRPARHQGGFFQQIVVILAISVLSGVLIAGLALPWVAMATKAADAASTAMKGFPLKLDFKPLDERTTVLDNEGSTLATFYDQNRVYVPLNNIADVMKEALISIEDSRFYQHGAIDVQGTIRALVVNSASSSTLQGGSSLTQQLVKLTLLSNATTVKQQRAATAQDYARKFQELRYAVWVENHYTKDQILEHYLNIAYFGDGAYGVQSAAHHYFDTTAAKLTLPQAAMLAGLVQSPSGYDPVHHPVAAKARRDTVITRMWQLGVISKRDKHKANVSDLNLHVTQIPNGCTNSEAPWFCQYLLSYLQHDPTLGATVAARNHAIYGGGLTIKTTLDPRYQLAADKAVADHVLPTDKAAVGAFAMVQPGTGAVKAVAQSRPMGTNKAKGETMLNFTVPTEYGGAAGFQPGSTFKAFVLSAAISQGIPLNTRFVSPNPVKVNERDYTTCSGHPVGSAIDTFHNEGTEAGTFDVYSGTAQSVNTYFVQLERLTGLCTPFTLANKMGMNLDPNKYEVVSLTLGVADESPVAMADAYATFAARGVYCPATPVTQILDRDGTPIPQPQQHCRRILRPAYADAVNSVLQGVMKGSGTGAALDIAQPTAGKTGTTDGSQSVWFIGYTPNMVGASVVAGVTPTLLPRSLTGVTIHGNYISFASGGGTAGPIWLQAMQAIERFLPNRNFVPPDPSVVKGQTVAIPSLFGYQPAAAAALLSRLGFKPQIAYSVSSNAPVGSVAYTSPSSQGVTGQTILIYISQGYTPPPPPPPPPSGGGGGNSGGGGGHGGGGGGGGGGHGGGGGGHGGGGGGHGGGGGGGGHGGGHGH
jgi:membrane peptidoglycan carboxypeptidase